MKWWMNQGGVMSGKCKWLFQRSPFDKYHRAKYDYIWLLRMVALEYMII